MSRRRTIDECHTHRREPKAATLTGITTFTVRSTISALQSTRVSGGDPTTILDASGYWRAAWTPAGSGAVHASIAPDGNLQIEGSWGAGGDWLAARLIDYGGQADTPVPIVQAVHPAVQRAQRNHPYVRLARTADLYHALLPTILGQRITAGEAFRQWSTLVRRLGSIAPGPHPRLRVPPSPAVLANQPAWAMHRWGIESKRASALRAVARHADKLWDWAALSPAECAAKLAMIPGVGPWTIGSVLGPALGDADAVAVGDFHLKNLVSWALAGRARGTDEQMLELLAPYAGQRGRVVRQLALDGWHPPAFGPRQRILPMASW